MSWIGVITDAGAALLAQWEQGSETLTIDGATVGSGFVAQANMRQATSLTNEKADAQIIQKKTVQNGIQFKIQIGPASAEVGAYTAHEIGLWGHLGSGESTLIALHQDDNEGVNIPLASVSPNFAFSIYLVHGISNNDTLEVEVDPGAYVSNSTMIEVSEETRSFIGFVEDTDTATHYIRKGEYVVWKGVLCTATSIIPIGTALSSSNLALEGHGAVGTRLVSLADEIPAYCIEMKFTGSSSNNMRTLTRSLDGLRPYVRFITGNNLCTRVRLTINGRSLTTEINRLESGDITFAIGFVKCTGDDTYDESHEGRYTFYSPAYNSQIKALSDELDSISRLTMRTVPFAIAVSDWSGSGSSWSATFNTAYVTTTSKEILTYTSSLRTAKAEDIDSEKKSGGGGIVFTTTKKPVADVAGTIYVWDDDDGKVSVILEDTVTPIANGGTGESSLAGAKSALGITELENKISTYEFAQDTLVNIQSAIVTYAGNMANRDVKEIAFVVSTATGVFANTT